MAIDMFADTGGGIPMRLTTILFSIFAATTLSLAACGGSSGGDDTAGDDTTDIDANTGAPDADTTVAKQLGDTCVPDAVTPGGPGDCGAGFRCLSLQGGTGAWCSKECTQGAGDTCNVGYTGAGIGLCFMSITFTQGGPATLMCGIICNDPAGDPMVCPAGECTDTCPGTLACTAPVNGGNPPMMVAEACQ